MFIIGVFEMVMLFMIVLIEGFKNLLNLGSKLGCFFFGVFVMVNLFFRFVYFVLVS